MMVTLSKKYPKDVMVNLEEEVHRQLNLMAEQQERMLSQEVRHLIKEALKHWKLEHLFEFMAYPTNRLMGGVIYSKKGHKK